MLNSSIDLNISIDPSAFADNRLTRSHSIPSHVLVWQSFLCCSSYHPDVSWGLILDNGAIHISITEPCDEEPRQLKSHGIDARIALLLVFFPKLSFFGVLTIRCSTCFHGVDFCLFDGLLSNSIRRLTCPSMCRVYYPYPYPYPSSTALSSWSFAYCVHSLVLCRIKTLILIHIPVHMYLVLHYLHGLSITVSYTTRYISQRFTWTDQKA